MVPKSLKSAIFAFLVLGLSGLPQSLFAESLTDALISAYQNNPTLKLNRAALRARDEAVAQARAGKRPVVDANGSGTISASSNSTRDITDTYQASLDASLVLYDGGQTRSAIESAMADVSAARASLVGIEQEILLDATTAYMDVRRDARFVLLAQDNIRVLTEQVRAARNRFEVGEVTRTDVAQARARLAAAESNLSASRGALVRSEQNYLATVGNVAGNPAPPPPLPVIPKSLDAVQSVAMREHPTINEARFNERAARFDVARARGRLRPSVSASGKVGYSRNTITYGDGNTSAAITLQGKIPLYQGGVLSSLVRQANDILARRKAELQDAGRVVIQTTAIAWANLNVARASIAANRQQVDAARIAFEGVTEEAKLGARTTLDALNAEQELLTAQSDLVAAQRDEYVAAYKVLSSMGLLTVKHLNLGIETYDPALNYNRVQNAPYGGFDGSVVDKIRDRWKN